MNHLQIRVSLGTLAITWNSQGLLTRLDWYDTCRLSDLTESSLVSSENGVGSWTAFSRVGIPPVMTGIVDRLRRYFDSGEPLGAIPWSSIDTRGWTDFQIRVYHALGRIPHGETETYAWVSHRLGKFAAPRAVGQALRRNPLPILIPCHRIVSATSLGGFMGMTDPNLPELKLKQRLIQLESTYINPSFPFLTYATYSAAEAAS